MKLYQEYIVLLSQFIHVRGITADWARMVGHFVSTQLFSIIKDNLEGHNNKAESYVVLDTQDQLSQPVVFIFFPHFPCMGSDDPPPPPPLGVENVKIGENSEKIRGP